MITTKNGTSVYHNDWGSRHPVVFTTVGLSAPTFEDQMFFLTQHGYRVMPHDRRGHRRSSQPWHGNVGTLGAQ
jgi:non-heme chloroperoxidase